MKKISFKITAITFVIIALALSFNSCKKKDTKVTGCTNPEALNYSSDANEDDGSCLTPEQKQRTSVINLTALWCGSCGSYGITSLISAYTTYPNDVVPLKVNLDDALASPIANTIAGNYVSGSYGIPYFIVGNQNDVPTSSINTTVESEIAGTPTAGVTGTFAVSGSTATVQTQVKFFSASSGDYYLAVYLMENGILASQTGALPDPYTHNHVLRGNIAGSGGFGELISTGSATANKVVTKTYTSTLTSGWNSTNMYAALVIWKKNGSKYDFVNAFQTKAN